MRRALCVAACVLLFLSLTAFHTAALPALSDAGEASGSTEESRDYLAELRETIPEAYRETIATQELTELIGAEQLFAYLWRGIQEEGGTLMTLFAALLGIVLLGRVAAELTAGRGRTAALSERLLISVCALAVFGVLSGSVAQVGRYLEDLQGFLNGSTPILTALLVAGGSAATGSAAAGAFSLGLVLMENLLTGVLYPLTGICFATGLLDAVSPELHMGGIARHLRWLYMTLLGAASALSTAALSFQTTLAASADSVAMRSARYAVGSLIPIVGGSIGAALGTLGSSLTLIKNTAGVTCVLVVLLMTLPSLLSLFLSRLAVSTAAAVSDLLGFTAGEKLLTSFSRVYDMLLAVTAAAGVTWILYFSVFLKIAYPMVG